MEEWLADRVVTIDALQAAVAEHAGKGRRGVGVLRRLLETRVLGDLRADSGVEALLAQVLARYGVPVPELHHEVRVGRATVAELDYAYSLIRARARVPRSTRRTTSHARPLSGARDGYQGPGRKDVLAVALEGRQAPLDRLAEGRPLGLGKSLHGIGERPCEVEAHGPEVLD